MDDCLKRPPIPRQEFVEPVNRVPGNAGEHVGEIGLRVHIVHFGRDDDAIHGGGAPAATIGTGEQPRLSSESDAAQGSFRGVVRQADAPIVEEAGERRPALEHIVHRFGDIVAARELLALIAHPAFQIGDQWRALLLPGS